MNKLILASFLPLLVQFCALHVAAKTLICYFTGIHRNVLPITDLLNSDCSIIVFWSLKLESDLSVQFYTSQDADYGKALLAARPKGSRTQVYIGVAVFNRDKDTCAKLLADQKEATRFSKLVYNYVESMGFDGVMMNLCDPESLLQKDNLGEVIKTMRSTFGPHIGLGMDVKTEPNQYYPIEQMNEYLNWVSVEPARLSGRKILYEGTDPDYRIETILNLWKKANVTENHLIGGLYFVALKNTIGIDATKEYNQVCDAKTSIYSPSNMDEQVQSGVFTNMITPTIYSVGQVAKLIQQSSYGGLYTLVMDYDDYSNVCGAGKFPLVTSMKRNMPDDPVTTVTTTTTSTTTPDTTTTPTTTSTTTPDTTTTPTTPTPDTTTTTEVITTSSSSAIPSCKGPGKLAAPDCHEYYNCRSAGRPPTVVKCPEGTRFNAQIKACENGEC